jgi:predicted phage baseplate assembly protein
VENVRVIVEDTTGAGALANIEGKRSSGEIVVTPLEGELFSLVPPLRVLTNLIDVSRGATVAREVLGSGNASLPGQTFVLAKGPLTYFRPTAQASGAERVSTLRVFVNDVEWSEVQSFYGQPESAHVFVTREDDEQRTHVIFGDGLHGARLPTGSGNVIALYRHGSGAASPSAGALTTLLAPQPGLVSVRNPVAAAGGADPASGAALRRDAPRATLALGMAVSADDYEAVAALVPGVTRARAAFSWDAAHQRALVTVWVHGPSGIDGLVKEALAAVADPNRPFDVKFAHPVPLAVTVTVQFDSRHLPEVVEREVRAALLDPASGLFGETRTRIGAVVYRSQIHAACSVSGVVAIRDCSVNRVDASNAVLLARSGNEASIDPGPNQFFQLDAANLHVQMEEALNAI